MAAILAFPNLYASLPPTEPTAIDPRVDSGRATRSSLGCGCSRGGWLVVTAAQRRLRQSSQLESALQSGRHMKSRSRPAPRSRRSPHLRSPRHPHHLAVVSRSKQPRRRWGWLVALLGLLQLGLVVQARQLSAQQQQLDRTFSCLERRLNYPGTYGGTRCLGTADPVTAQTEL